MNECVRCHKPITRRDPSALYCFPCKDKSQSEGVRAGKIVREAIEAGRLPHPSTLECADCGDWAWCYDHRDYSKPLDVEPVCRHCNWWRGPAVWPKKKH